MSAIALHGGNAVTMTSIELVEFINSHRKQLAEVAMVDFPSKGFAKLEHADFLKKALEVLGEDAGNFSGYYKASNGKQNPMYTFPKREACLMAMSYSYELQAKVFDKMTELEQKVGTATAINPANLTRLQLIEIAMQAEQERLVLEHKVEELTPKADALDRIADADGTMNPTVAAKTLQIQPKRLFDWLREKHWIYRRPGGSGNVAYQDKIQAGYLTHKVTTVHRDDGTEKVVEQVLVTGKGLAKLSQALATQ